MSASAMGDSLSVRLVRRASVHALNITVAAATLLVCTARTARTQGITTAGIRGTVRGEDGARVDGAHARVVHEPTGFAVEVVVRRGHFLVQGLEPGGPYTVVVRRVGLTPQRRERIVLSLGELMNVEFLLRALPTQLDPVQVIAGASRTYSPAHAHGGTGTTFGEQSLQRLPTLNRDMFDFVRLVPQVSTKIGLPNTAFSAAGVGFRFNNFLVNGVSERTVAGGVSIAFPGAKSVPLDAVQEYQVLVAPYDVRYGDFAGALVNTVTKSGSNRVRGSAFVYGRNDRLARRGASAPSGEIPYERVQYGFSVGGPIIRDRLHFFVAPELQQFTFRAAGPYAGQPENAARPVPVSASDLTRVDEIMRRYGLEAGSAGAVENGNPLRNMFTRVDLALPRSSSRVSLWNNYSGTDVVAFSRAARDTFSLSSLQTTTVTTTHMTALHVHTALPRAGGGHNELLVSYRSGRMASSPAVEQPIVRISVPSTTGGRVTINTGTHEVAQGLQNRSYTKAVKDNLTLPLGASHVLTVGAEIERFAIRRAGVLGSYGTWTFASLDDLERGVADRYERGIDFGSSRIPLDGSQYAAYVSDQWQASERLSVTLGVRADVLAVDGRPPYHPGVDSIFARRTDVMPRRRVEISPRTGFVWDISGSQRHHLRGGIGVFAGRFPLAWAHTALSSYGMTGGVLRCGRSPADLGPPPPFTPNAFAPPTTCANGVGLGLNQRGDVDLLDRNLRMMRTTRASLAYDRRLGERSRFTVESVVTRMLSDFVFVNLNLGDPRGVDRNGRVMYGTLSPLGIATPDLRSNFSEVIEVRNTSRNHAMQLAARLEKDWADRVSGAVSYTYSRVRDAQTPLRVNTRGLTAWASSRVVSGRHDDYTAGISSNDIRHRVVMAGTYAVGPQRRRTGLAFYYVGESGRPFTYIASGTLRRGDLNADGTNANDPIYVPLSAFDTNEIRFEGTAEAVVAQQSALERLVERTSCLRRQRGRILERNSCREPWSNTTVASLRQAIPVRDRVIEAQLDVFNVLNLLSSRWGIRREAAAVLLDHVGQTTGPIQTSHSIFRFDPAATGTTVVPTESAFQLQFALRYRF